MAPGALRRRLRSRRFVVVDDSMLPGLRPGDRLLIDPGAFRRRPPQVGDVVVARDPEAGGRLLIKRVTDRDRPPGTVTLLGDARDRSRDSRAFGPVPYRSIVGLVWFRYLPRERRGPIGDDDAPDGPKS
jgi:nickel-type superoxide dismutase maturation protease